MNLYEALKAGTSEEELLKAFHKDLNEANERIAAEKKAEEETVANKEFLDECRIALAACIVNYFEALFGNGSTNLCDEEDIEEILMDFEEEIREDYNFLNKINKSLSKSTGENKTPVEIKITTHPLFNNELFNKFFEKL